MSDDDANSIRQRLLSHLVRLTHVGDAALVIKKLCTALVAYYLRPTINWEPCIKHLMLCFARGFAISVEEVNQFNGPSLSIVEGLTERPLRAVLWFAGGLVDEVVQSNSASIQTCSTALTRS